MLLPRMSAGKSDDLVRQRVEGMAECGRQGKIPLLHVTRVAFAELAPGTENTPAGTRIIVLAAQVPVVAQRSLLFRPSALARERGRAGERETLAPQTAERVLVAGDRMQRCERGASIKHRFRGDVRRGATTQPGRRRGEGRRGFGDDSAPRGHAKGYASAALCATIIASNRRTCRRIITSDNVALSFVFFII
ncbi:hypothetical protein ACVW0J_010447 [Bradyrhizobium sp. i1.7.7]